MLEGIIPLAIFAVSLIAVYYGARFLTDSSSHFARVAGVSDFVIGATIVALGTSLPEVAASISAMLSGHPGIIVGNVLGSNAANMGLALGISAMLYPFYVSRVVTDIDIPLLLASALSTVLVFSDGRVTWIEGVIMISLYAAYIYREISEHLEGGKEREKESREAFNPRYLPAFAVGFILLYFGARYLVSSLTEISQMLGLSESVVSFLLLAVGTSIPEVATCIVAARDGRGDIAMGNVLGSNTINSLVVLGISSLLGDVTATRGFLQLTLPTVMVISILLGFMALNNRLTRLEGAILFLIYLLAASMVL